MKINVMTPRGPIDCDFRVWNGPVVDFHSGVRTTAMNDGLRALVPSRKSGNGLTSIKLVPPTRAGAVRYSITERPEAGGIKVAFIGMEDAKDLDTLMEIDSGMHMEGIDRAGVFVIYPIDSKGYIVPKVSMHSAFEAVMKGVALPMTAGSAAPSLEDSMARARRFEDEMRAAMAAKAAMPKDEREFMERLRAKLDQVPETPMTIPMPDAYKLSGFLVRLKAKVRR